MSELGNIEAYKAELKNFTCKKESEHYTRCEDSKGEFAGSVWNNGNNTQVGVKQDKKIIQVFSHNQNGEVDNRCETEGAKRTCTDKYGIITEENLKY